MILFDTVNVFNKSEIESKEGAASAVPTASSISFLCEPPILRMERPPRLCNKSILYLPTIPSGSSYAELSVCSNLK